MSSVDEKKGTALETFWRNSTIRNKLIGDFLSLNPKSPDFNEQVNILGNNAYAEMEQNPKQKQSLNAEQGSNPEIKPAPEQIANTTLGQGTVQDAAQVQEVSGVAASPTPDQADKETEGNTKQAVKIYNPKPSQLYSGSILQYETIGNSGEKVLKKVEVFRDDKTEKLYVFDGKSRNKILEPIPVEQFLEENKDKSLFVEEPVANGPFSSEREFEATSKRPSLNDFMGGLDKNIEKVRSNLKDTQIGPANPSIIERDSKTYNKTFTKEELEEIKRYGTEYGIDPERFYKEEGLYELVYAVDQMVKNEGNRIDPNKKLSFKRSILPILRDEKATSYLYNKEKKQDPQKIQWNDLKNQEDILSLLEQNQPLENKIIEAYERGDSIDSIKELIKKEKELFDREVKGTDYDDKGPNKIYIEGEDHINRLSEAAIKRNITDATRKKWTELQEENELYIFNKNFEAFKKKYQINYSEDDKNEIYKHVKETETPLEAFFKDKEMLKRFQTAKPLENVDHDLYLQYAIGDRLYTVLKSSRQAVSDGFRALFSQSEMSQNTAIASLKETSEKLRSTLNFKGSIFDLPDGVFIQALNNAIINDDPELTNLIKLDFIRKKMREETNGDENLAIDASVKKYNEWIKKIADAISPGEYNTPGMLKYVDESVKVATKALPSIAAGAIGGTAGLGIGIGLAAVSVALGHSDAKNRAYQELMRKNFTHKKALEIVNDPKTNIADLLWRITSEAASLAMPYAKYSANPITKKFVGTALDTGLGFANGALDRTYYDITTGKEVNFQEFYQAGKEEAIESLKKSVIQTLFDVNTLRKDHQQFKQSYNEAVGKRGFTPLSKKFDIKQSLGQLYDAFHARKLSYSDLNSILSAVGASEKNVVDFTSPALRSMELV